MRELLRCFTFHAERLEQPEVWGHTRRVLDRLEGKKIRATLSSIRSAPCVAKPTWPRSSANSSNAATRSRNTRTSTGRRATESRNLRRISLRRTFAAVSVKTSPNSVAVGRIRKASLRVDGR